MGQVIELKVCEGGQRLDKYVGQMVPDLSRSRAQKLIEEGLVTVNDGMAKPSHRVEVGAQYPLGRRGLLPLGNQAQALPGQRCG